MHVRQAVVAALVLESQALVVDAKRVQDRCLQVVQMDAIFGDVVTEIVRGAVGCAGPDAAAGHPN